MNIFYRKIVSGRIEINFMIGDPNKCFIIKIELEKILTVLTFIAYIG